MTKKNEYTGRVLHVEELDTVWSRDETVFRTLYRVVGTNNYYTDYTDCDSSITPLGDYNSVEEALDSLGRWCNYIEEERGL